MRIDAYTHFIPEKYFNKIVESGHADIGKRVREIPCIHDLDVRRKIVDSFKDYADGANGEQRARACELLKVLGPGFVASTQGTAPDQTESRRALVESIRSATSKCSANGK